jgi:methyl coenzyme M reductase subunit C
MEGLKSIIDHRGLKEPVRKLREELVFQSILANHDTVGIPASIAMTGAAAFDVSPASVAGDNRHS